ncbi:glutathione S-transferase family protein [Sporobolomyces koalae]|uniref:glutathione S-transferase family protein n=1 Tax=Sporobolomyces koalae TaxID=500713 RepID=UPI00316BB1EB
MSTPVLRTEAPSELSNPGLVCVWGNSPNGWKICYALEALKQAGAIPDYTAVNVFLQKGEQFQEWFIKLNPNSKMPVLIDNRPNKPPLHVFESGAILQYLARVYDKEYLYTFEDDDLFQEMLNWIHLVQANLGPQQGQLNHFSRYTQVKCDYSHDRFRTEVNRIYGVYEKHLASRSWLVGDKPSYADMCTQPWFRVAFWASLDLEPFPNVRAYIDRVESLPFVQKALQVPEQDLVTRIKSNPKLEQEIMERMKKEMEVREQEAKEREAAQETGQAE